SRDWSSDVCSSDLGSNHKKFKIRLFYTIALLLPVLFFFLLEGLLRLLNYGESYPLFIEDENSALYFKQNTEFAKRYFNNLDEVPHSAYDVFLKEKLPRTFRVFVLGASSAAGFPYNGGATF